MWYLRLFKPLDLAFKIWHFTDFFKQTVISHYFKWWLSRSNLIYANKQRKSVAVSDFAPASHQADF